MLPYSDPVQLNSLESIREIEQLRLTSWSFYYPYLKELNSGMNRDVLDYISVHFVSHDLQGKLVAANRITILEDLSQLPFAGLLNQSLYPDKVPFAYFSKLVVHPEYRKQGLKELMDQARTRFLLSQGLDLGLGLYGAHRVHDALTQGFSSIEVIEEGTESFFPYNKRSLHVMSLLSATIRTPHRSGSLMEEAEENG